MVNAVCFNSYSDPFNTRFFRLHLHLPRFHDAFYLILVKIKKLHPKQHLVISNLSTQKAKSSLDGVIHPIIPGCREERHEPSAGSPCPKVTRNPNGAQLSQDDPAA